MPESVQIDRQHIEAETPVAPTGREEAVLALITQMYEDATFGYPEAHQAAVDQGIIK